jgi:hypothetical protein
VRLVDQPLEFSLVLAGLALLLIFLLSRTAWRPSAPLRLARRRAWGQILSAAARMYVVRTWLFVAMGVLFVPIALLVTLLQALVLHATNVLEVQTGGESSGLLAVTIVAIGTALTLLALGVVQAATVRALVEIDQGRPAAPLRAYRLAFDSVAPLFGALVVASVVISVLASSIFLLPTAVWVAGRWALIAPAIELERVSALGALRRSGQLVRKRWLKVATLIVAGGALVLVGGPLIGVLLILATSAPFWLVNMIAGFVYAVTMPFVALTTAYVYFDARVRTELAGEQETPRPARGDRAFLLSRRADALQSGRPASPGSRGAMIRTGDDQAGEATRALAAGECRRARCRHGDPGRGHVRHDRRPAPGGAAVRDPEHDPQALPAAAHPAARVHHPRPDLVRRRDADALAHVRVHRGLRDPRFPDAGLGDNHRLGRERRPRLRTRPLAGNPA